MTQLNKETLLKRFFSDTKNYPYGFSRSGDFSISESKALSEYGCLFAALVDGHFAPSDKEDEQFLASALGQSEPQSAPERAWLKYQKRINRPKAANIHGCKKVNAEVEEDELIASIDDDMVIDLDD